MRLLARIRALPGGISALLKTIGRGLAAFGPAFWQFLIGLGFVYWGVYAVYPPAAYFLIGLLLVWDAARPADKP